MQYSEGGLLYLKQINSGFYKPSNEIISYRHFNYL